MYRRQYCRQFYPQFYPRFCRFTFVSLLLVTAACSDNRTDAAAQPQASELASASASASASPETGRPSARIVGTLLEQIPVEPYVYVRLETADGELWAAVNEALLTVGQSVTVYNAFAMEQFESQTLDRTFERIYFGSLEPLGDAATGAAAAPGAFGAEQPDGMGTMASADIIVDPVAKAQGKGARTINQLWQEKDQLVGVTVSVRGVVVKYNAAVMGKNWIHLQDGSGDATHGTHDLVVTTADAAAVGDTVTITGVVSTDQDVGAGYVYALMVEQARVVAP